MATKAESSRKGLQVAIKLGKNGSKWQKRQKVPKAGQKQHNKWQNRLLSGKKC